MKFFVVDDDPDSLALVTRLLTGAGHEVVVRGSSVEALRDIPDMRPDCVITDVMMPVMSGHDVCLKVRERADLRHIKILMLSAKGYAAEVNKGMAIGADVYMTKPFSTKELLSKVDQLLDLPA